MNQDFNSLFVNDPLPLQKITYLDLILESPTQNSVVKETLFRSLKLAENIGQSPEVVTYDLAVVLKAYSMQALEVPALDNVLILLGSFHLEMAFFGALGTFINESGGDHLLVEAGVLAGGSLMGFHFLQQMYTFA